MNVYLFTFLIIIVFKNLKENPFSSNKPSNYRSSTNNFIIPQTQQTPQIMRKLPRWISYEPIGTKRLKPLISLRPEHSMLSVKNFSKKLRFPISRINSALVIRRYFNEIRRNSLRRRHRIFKNIKRVFRLPFKQAKRNQIILQFLFKKYINKIKNPFQKLYYEKEFSKVEILSFFIVKKLNLLVANLGIQFKLRFRAFEDNKLTHRLIFQFYKSFCENAIKDTISSFKSMVSKKRGQDISFRYFLTPIVQSICQEIFIEQAKSFFLANNVQEPPIQFFEEIKISKRKKKKIKKIWFRRRFGQLPDEFFSFLWKKFITNFYLMTSVRILSSLFKKKNLNQLALEFVRLEKNTNNYYIETGISPRRPTGFKTKSPEHSYVKFIQEVILNLRMQKQRKEYLIKHALKFLRGKYFAPLSPEEEHQEQKKKQRRQKRYRRKIFFQKIAKNKDLFRELQEQRKQRKIWGTFDSKSQNSYRSRRDFQKRYFSTALSKSKYIKQFFKGYLITDDFNTRGDDVFKYIQSNSYGGPYKFSNKLRRRFWKQLQLKSIANYERYRNRLFNTSRRKLRKKITKRLLKDFVFKRKYQPLFYLKRKRGKFFRFKALNYNKFLNKKKFKSLFDDYSFSWKRLGRLGKLAFYKRYFNLGLFRDKKEKILNLSFSKRYFKFLNNRARLLKVRWLAIKGARRKHRRVTRRRFVPVNCKQFNFIVSFFFKNLKPKGLRDIFSCFKYIYFFSRNPAFFFKTSKRFKWFLQRRPKKRRIGIKRRLSKFARKKRKINKTNEALRYEFIGHRRRHIVRELPTFTQFFPGHFTVFRKITEFLKERKIKRTENTFSSFLNDQLISKNKNFASSNLNSRYYLFFKKKKNNFYITITDHKGGVVFFQSCGYYLVKSLQKRNKKVRGAYYNLKFMFAPIALKLQEKKINKIHTFFQNRHLPKWWLKRLCRNFINKGISISQVLYTPSVSHGSRNKKKKVRRL